MVFYLALLFVHLCAFVFLLYLMLKQGFSAYGNEWLYIFLSIIQLSNVSFDLYLFSGSLAEIVGYRW